MNDQELLSYIPKALEGIQVEMEQTDFPVVRVNSEVLLEACERLKSDKQLEMHCLHLLTVVDYVEYYEVVYHLYSYSKAHMAIVKVKIDHDEPVIPSVYGVWKGADFQEREGFDLFGVRFEGHPNLKRLLLVEGWEGHPMRRDFKLEQPAKES